MVDYFSVFEQPVNFFIDKTILRKKYLQMIKEFQNSDAENQLSLIHLAYKTLNDDELRIEYFLKKWNFVQEDGSSEIKLSSEFLMEIMELSDAIQGGNTNALQEAQNILNQNINTIYELFKGELNESNKQKIAQKYFERKYLKRLIENKD